MLVYISNWVLLKVFDELAEAKRHLIDTLITYFTINKNKSATFLSNHTNITGMQTDKEISEKEFCGERRKMNKLIKQQDQGMGHAD